MIIHFLFTKSYYIEHESGSSHCGMLLKKAVLKIKTKSLKNTGGKTQFLVRFEAYIYRKNFVRSFNQVEHFHIMKCTRASITKFGQQKMRALIEDLNLYYLVSHDSTEIFQIEFDIHSFPKRYSF